MGRLKGICISEKRGTEKHEVREAMVKMDWGIEGDAHGGKWHRQISLLSDEKIQEFRAKGAEVAYGAFGENLIVEGFDFRALPVGTRFHIRHLSTFRQSWVRFCLLVLRQSLYHLK